MVYEVFIDVLALVLFSMLVVFFLTFGVFVLTRPSKSSKPKPPKCHDCGYVLETFYWCPGCAEEYTAEQLDAIKRERV